MSALNIEQQLTIRDIQVRGADAALAARLYTTGDTAKKNDALMVFFHSGGFCGGDLADADHFLRLVVESSPGLNVLAANYTLANVSPFPAAVDDAYAVLAWARQNKAKLGWSGKHLVAAGIEAGANLAAVCALMSRDRADPALAGQILIMPMLDPSLSSESMRDQPEENPGMSEVTDGFAAAYRDYLPNAVDRFHPYASPLQSSRLKNLASALILSTEGDPLMDEAEEYGNKLIGCGVKTTVRRLPPVPLYDTVARNECACRVMALEEISGFIRGLGGGKTGAAG